MSELYDKARKLIDDAGAVPSEAKAVELLGNVVKLMEEIQSEIETRKGELGILLEEVEWLQGLIKGMKENPTTPYSHLAYVRHARMRQDDISHMS